MTAQLFVYVVFGNEITQPLVAQFSEADFPGSLIGKYPARFA